MDPKASTSRYILTALAIILVITAFVLIALNALTIQQGGTPFLSGANQYKAGYLAARARYQTMFPSLAQPITTLNGTVADVLDNGLYIQATNVDTDMTADGLDDHRTVLTTDATVIQKITNKDPGIFAQEMSDAAKNGTPPPQPFTAQTMKLSEINVGDAVSVSVSEDARTNGQVTATTINVR